MVRKGVYSQISINRTIYRTEKKNRKNKNHIARPESKGAVSKDSSLCRIRTDGERRSVYERNYHYRKT